MTNYHDVLRLGDVHEYTLNGKTQKAMLVEANTRIEPATDIAWYSTFIAENASNPESWPSARYRGISLNARTAEPGNIFWAVIHIDRGDLSAELSLLND